MKTSDLDNHAKNVVLTHNENFSAVNLNLYTAVLTEENFVAFLNIRRNELAFADLSFTNCYNAAALRALLSVIWEDNPTN
jgi:hypothetical protein